MKQFVRRIVSSLRPGGSKKHLIDIARALGLPTEVLHSMQSSDFAQCEEAFLRAIQGKHGCTVDWKARPEEIRESLGECMNPEEIALFRTIPIANERTASGTVLKLAKALQGTPMPRSLVLLESFGDFVIVLLVPKAQKENIEALANGWLIR